MGDLSEFVQKFPGIFGNGRVTFMNLSESSNILSGKGDNRERDDNRMDFLSIFTNYWLQWLLGIIAAGIAFGAKHYVKLQKKSWQDKWDSREASIKTDIMDKFDQKIQAQVEASDEADKKIKNDIETLTTALSNVTRGILSIQGRQFLHTCHHLLEQDHVITIDEYEAFNDDYDAYKALGGNHRGDVLYKSVVAKFE